jgi:hypothetical protein
VNITLLAPIPLTPWFFVFVLMLISQAMIFLAAYLKLDRLEGHFIASHLVSICRNTAGNGPFGRMKRVRLIGALTGSFDKYQMLDPYAFMEAEILPAHLRRWVAIPKRLMRIALACIGLLVLWYGIASLLTTISKPVSDLKLLFISLLVGCIALMLLFRLVWIYLSFFRLEELESHLDQSYFVGRNRRVMGDGFYGRYYRVAHIAGMLFQDEVFLSRSDPHAMTEIERFPLHLRRLVMIPDQFFCYSFIGFCAVFLCGKFFGLLG